MSCSHDTLVAERWTMLASFPQDGICPGLQDESREQAGVAVVSIVLRHVEETDFNNIIWVHIIALFASFGL